MTSKKRRQRGSRTHGGGSHKKRRGAGHRGGRGRAGRKKHEKGLYPPQGKHGFSRPQKTDIVVKTINVRELDEDAVVLIARDLASETDDGITIDARDVVEDGHEADQVKVLGAGQVHESLHVTADAFSADATAAIEGADGSTELTERGLELAAAADSDTTEEEEA